jgi:Domain of Unknown Function (DUF928)
MNYLYRKTTWKVLSLTSFCLMHGTTQIQAQKINTSSPLNKQSSGQKPPPPPRRGGDGNGTPNGRVGTGTQGPCTNVPQNNGDNLIALVPFYDMDTLTTEDHPTFWFFIPHKANEFHSTRLEIRNAADKKIYVANPKANNVQPGVISVSLPQNEPPLEVNQKYSIRFTLYCKDPQTVAGRGNSFVVRASLTRVAVNAELKKQLEAAKTPQDKAKVYAKNGIWLDAVTTLGNSRRTDANNAALNTAWADLMKNLQLPDIASKPIVDSGQLNTLNNRFNGRVAGEQ